MKLYRCPHCGEETVTAKEKIRLGHVVSHDRTTSCARCGGEIVLGNRVAQYALKLLLPFFGMALAFLLAVLLIPLGRASLYVAAAVSGVVAIAAFSFFYLRLPLRKKEPELISLR